MKGLPILVLLSSVLQLYSAAPALEAVTCSKNVSDAAAPLAIHHINEHHEHGYKFRLLPTQGGKVEMVDGGCNIQLHLDLGETSCHTVNPKYFGDCELREEHRGAVSANCTVTMTVRNGEAKITKHECDTHQATMELHMTCPDCPTLIPLNDPEGLKSIEEAVKKFNQNTTNQHYYKLQEVGRIMSGYIMGSGMNYYTEFVLVETLCPMGSRISLEACTPLCPDRAHHTLCSSSYSNYTGTLMSLECEFYPPTNTAALGLGEQEPVCVPPHPAGPTDPPGPPVDPTSQERDPVFNVTLCPQPFVSDQTIHPIYPWPLPDHHPTPRHQA